MLSKSLKKKLAVLLTGAMILGMNVTAFAGATSGSVDSQGTGNFEGHVNRQVVDVTLPTVSANTTPFSFVYDPEGLIAATGGNAYGDGFTFAGGKNVYFKTADKTYGNESTQFTVSNNSSVSVNIALKVDVTAGAKDPKLVGSTTELPDDVGATQASGDPSLYLGLTVGGTVQELAGFDKADTYSISGNGITKKFCVAGNPDNYSVSTNTVGVDAAYPHAYEFKKNANATNWDAITFKLTGQANKVDNAKGMTAPNLKVTWSFEPTDELEEAGSGSGSGSGGSTTTYTEKSAYAEWEGEKLWLGATKDDGFEAETITVEVKGKTGDFAAFTDYTYSEGWVGIQWDDIETAIGADNASPYSVRITDGTTRYTYTGE